MKKGQMIEESFISTISEVINEMTSEDDMLSIKKVRAMRNIRKHIKLKGRMRMVCVINNLSLVDRNLRPVNSLPWELHKNAVNNVNGFTIWEITSLESLVRSERNFRKSKKIDVTDIMAFQVSEKGDIDAPKRSIFDLAESVRIVDDKWEYKLV